MGFEADFGEFMTQTLSLRPWTGQDGYGSPTYGPATSIRCRVVGWNRMVRDSDGREVVSDTTVYLAGSYHISPKDEVTMPDGSKYPIVSIGNFPDERGDHHTVLYMRKRF